MIDKVTKPLKNIDKNLTAIRKNMEGTSKAVRGLSKGMLGLGLGLTFFMFGIQIQLKKVLKTAFQFFKEAQGETGALITQFNILRANLGGIAIAFFDAVAASGFLQRIIDVVIRIRQWFFNLDETTREWLSSSVFVFLGIITFLSLIGQALLAVFVLSQLNPIFLAVTVIVIALGVLAGEFVSRKDQMKTAWGNLMDDLKNPDISGITKLKLAILDLQIILLNVMPTLLGVFGAIAGAAIGARSGGIVGTALGGLAGFGAGFGFGKFVQTQALPDFQALRAKVSAEATPPDPFEIIDQIRAGFNESLQKNPIPVKPSDDPLKVVTPGNTPLNITNTKDEKRTTQLQKLIDDGVIQAETQVDKLDSLLIEMQQLKDRPIEVFVTTTGGGGGR